MPQAEDLTGMKNQRVSDLGKRLHSLAGCAIAALSGEQIGHQIIQ